MSGVNFIFVLVQVCNTFGLFYSGETPDLSLYRRMFMESSLQVSSILAACIEQSNWWNLVVN